MPLSVGKEAFKSAMKSFVSSGSEENEANSEIIDKLADAIEAFIKSAQVDPGIPVTTPVGPGSTSGPGKLS